MLENSYSFKESEDIEPVFWSTPNSMRKIFKRRAASANLPYYPPHTFRHSAVLYALRTAGNGEEVKAVSQNFGHEDLGTTLSIYANFSDDHLMNVLENMEKRKNIDLEDEVLLKRLTELIKNKNLRKDE